MVKPGVYVDKKQLQNGEKTTEYVQVEVQPIPPKPSSTDSRKGCTCMRLLGIFLFILVLVGIAVCLTFAIRWDHHPENNGEDCLNCYGDWTPAPPPGEPHHGHNPITGTPEDRPDRPPEDYQPGTPGDDDDDDGGHHGGPGGHHGGPGNDDGGHHGGHHGGPGNHDGDDDDGGHHGGHGGHHGGNDDDHGGHDGGPGHHGGGNQGGHNGRPEDHDGHGGNDGRPDDEQMPPIDYVGTPMPLLGRPDGHDGFHRDDNGETERERRAHGSQYHPRFTGVESWKRQKAMLQRRAHKYPSPHERSGVQMRSRVEIEEEALERSPHAGKNHDGRKRF